MSIPLFDAHCDTISALFEEGGNLYENNLHLDLLRLCAYKPAAQFFAIWGGYYEEKAALLKAEVSKHSDCIVFCKTPADARAAHEAGKAAAFLSVEGAEQIGCSIEKLRAAHENDGLLMLNLCWNNDNDLCGSAMDGKAGLSDKGQIFVLSAQEMGVVIDLSHASERTFWDVIEISARPLVASHSNSKKLCAHPRNLTDRQFEALVGTGGGAGLNLCPDFIAENPDVDCAVGHIEHFLSLGGEKSLFMGADLDGVDSLPKEFCGVEDIGKIYDALLRRNYSESLVRDIFYNNLISILERAL